MAFWGALAAGLGGALLNAGSRSASAQVTDSNEYGQNSSVSNSHNEGGGSSFNYTDGTGASQMSANFAQMANAQGLYNWDLAAKYNSLEAEKQRAWQERMSNTAHQREVADLKLAHLNPILSAWNTGASTPSGGYGAMQSAQAFMANAYANSEGASSNYEYGDSNSSSYGWNKSSSHSEPAMGKALSGIGTALSAVGNWIIGKNPNVAKSKRDNARSASGSAHGGGGVYNR